LRENLDTVAVLHKSGAFANHWELKAEYQVASGNVDQTAAPDVGAEGDDSDVDGDDDEIEMEDVA
jgi:transcription initiation factor TFIIF subunit beta